MPKSSKPNTSPPVDIHCLREGIMRKEPVILQILYDSFAPSLYGKITNVVEDPVRACNILKKTFVYAITHIHQHNIHLRLHSWLWQIAGFKILEDAANACVGNNLPEDKELEHYLRAWSQVSEADREVLELSIFKGSSHSEMAAWLELPLDTVQQRISSALTQFHRLFKLH